MQKLFVCIPIFVFVLCLAFPIANAMASAMEIEENPLAFVKEQRRRSHDFYQQGQTAENLWHKRKFFLWALKASREISENFPDLRNQADRNHYILIKNTMAHYAGRAYVFDENDEDLMAMTD